MLYIVWDKDNGEALPEGKVRARVEEVIRWHEQDGAALIHIGCETLFNGFRAKIHMGALDHEKVHFSMAEEGKRFGGDRLTIDKNARLPVWPPDLCDLNTHFLEIILTPKKEIDNYYQF